MYRNTDRPIAIAYTPTEPSAFNPNPNHHAASESYSNANHATSVISEIREDYSHDSRDPEPVRQHDDNGDFDRGENYKQDFQAPFYPSVNLDRAQNPVRNSWAIVTPPPSSGYYQGNRLNAIDRSDNNVSEEPTKLEQKQESAVTNHPKSSPSSSAIVDHSEHTTEPFDPDKFQPEFQGGFKPIYPPGATTPKTQIESKSNETKQSTNVDEEEDSIESLISDFLSGGEPESTTSN